MSIRNLEQEVKRRVISVVEDTKLVDIKGGSVVPIVETGVLPGDVVKGKPYVLIQTTDITDGDLESEVDVLMVYGTVGLGKQDRVDKEKSDYVHATGHWDIISLIDKIRADFLKDTNFEFGVLERKMKHEVFGQIEDINYLGESKLKFKVSTIAPEGEYL